MMPSLPQLDTHMTPISPLRRAVFAAALLGALLCSASAQITYTRLQQNGVLTLHQMRADGTGDTTVNLPFTQVGFPRWSQDGTQLSFTAFRPSNTPTHTWNVFQIGAGTGVLQKLTDYHDLLDTGNPAFSYTFP